MQLYVQAKSKKALNERLSNGERISGTNHSIFGGGGQYALDSNLPDGTIICIFEKMVAGSPYSKAYGQWQAGKVK